MKNKILGVIAGLTLAAAGAQAAGGQGSVGLQAGWGIPGEDGIAGGLGFGATVDYNVVPEFSVGAYAGYQMLALDPEVSGASISQIPFGLTANWNAMGGPGFYVGANLGMLRSSVEVSSISVSTSDLSFGGQVGFDFPINDQMAVGAEGRYLYIMSDGDSGSLIQANAQFKFMF